MRNVFELYTCYCESSKSLEGDCGMDKVPRCRLLMPFEEGTHNKSEKKYKFCKQCGRLNYSRYSHVSLLTFVITGKLLASHFY